MRFAVAGVNVVPRSISSKLKVLLATVFSVGVLIALSAAWFFSTAAATDAYDRLLISAAAQLGEGIKVDRGHVVVVPPDSVFETLAQSADDRFFYAVRGPDGALLTGYPALQNLAPRMPGGAPILHYQRFDGADMRAVSLFHLIASPNANGWCSVVVVQTLDARHRLVLRLMLKIGAIVLFVSALGFVASLHAVRRALRPFDRIGQALAERRAQDTAPLTISSPTETQALVEAINSAFQRLNERMTKLQAFAAVAAHQIRTPLAALSAQTELLLTDKTKQARVARADRLRHHTSKLSRLTNQLLGQAMVTYRTERIPHQQVELIELIHQVLLDAIPESLTRDLAVEFEAPDGHLHIDGDSVLIREALVNLVSNAVTHGARSLIRMRVLVEDASALVCVLDDGPGIPRECWDDATQPFRLPRGERDGAGLGLSIAADVARAHGGDLHFSFADDGMFQISLRLTRARGHAT